MAKSDVKAPAKEKAAKSASDNGKTKAASKSDITVAEKLVELYRLQYIDSQVDRSAFNEVNCLWRCRTWKMK
jgi:hypothetical protein